MNDFNIAAMLLKSFDSDKWNRLTSTTKHEIINDFLEFRNRIIMAANIGNAASVFTEEVEKAEKKFVVPEKQRCQTIKLVERKTESDYIAEGRMKIKWIEKP